MPAMLTVHHNLDGTESYGSSCPEHPEWTRDDLAQRHAMNVVAKHNRESHAEPALNLSAAARTVAKVRTGMPGAYPGAILVWANLVGLNTDQAETYLAAVLAEPDDVVVHVAPF